MRLTPEEKRICREYGKRDESGHVHCSACPLVRESDVTDIMCKAIGHYDETEGTWIPDAWEAKND